MSPPLTTTSPLSDNHSNALLLEETKSGQGVEIKTAWGRGRKKKLRI